MKGQPGNSCNTRHRLKSKYAVLRRRCPLPSRQELIGLILCLNNRQRATDVHTGAANEPGEEI